MPPRRLPPRCPMTEPGFDEKNENGLVETDAPERSSRHDDTSRPAHGMGTSAVARKSSTPHERDHAPHRRPRSLPTRNQIAQPCPWLLTGLRSRVLEGICHGIQLSGRVKVPRIVVDRPGREAAVGIAGAWIAFMLVLPVYIPDIRQLSDMLVGALVGAGLIVVGFAAASRVRPVPDLKWKDQLRLAGLSLVLGALLGTANLGVNFGLASVSPVVHQLLVERFSQISPLASLAAAPVVEEIAFRLFFLSAVAFVVSRFVEDQRFVFWIALGLSAVVFGVMHVVRPMPESTGLAWAYGTGVAVKSGLASLLLGWIFWRWGLGFAIVSHSAANGAHQLLAPLLFG